MDEPHLDAARSLEMLGGPGHIVASSYGALAAIIAAQAGQVLSLVLLEPACLELARGYPHVEEHIRRMTPVYDAASDPGVDDLEWSKMFGIAASGHITHLPVEELVRGAHRLRATAPPWQVPLDPRVFRSVPTLVVDGGRGDMYEETARAIAAMGATRSVAAGSSHRIQDFPGINEEISAWQSSVTR